MSLRALRQAHEAKYPHGHPELPGVDGTPPGKGFFTQAAYKARESVDRQAVPHPEGGWVYTEFLRRPQRGYHAIWFDAEGTPRASAFGPASTNITQLRDHAKMLLDNRIKQLQSGGESQEGQSRQEAPRPFPSEPPRTEWEASQPQHRALGAQFD